MKITIYVHPEDLSDLGDALQTFTHSYKNKEEMNDDRPGDDEITLVDFIRISLFPHDGFVQTLITYHDYNSCIDLGIFEETTRV